MEKTRDYEMEITAAVTVAVNLFLDAEAHLNIDEIKPPPYIILPSVLASQPSPWRFVGREELMSGRTMVQMKSLRW